MRFNRGCSYPMSVLKRCLIQCIARHSGIFCASAGFLQGLLLLSGLYSGTESVVKCGGGVSSFFPVHTGVRQGCVLAPSLFNTCMDWLLGRVVDQSYCGAIFSITKITDLFLLLMQ